MTPLPRAPLTAASCSLTPASGPFCRTVRVCVCKCVTARMHVCVGQEVIQGGKTHTYMYSYMHIFTCIFCAAKTPEQYSAAKRWNAPQGRSHSRCIIMAARIYTPLPGCWQSPVWAPCTPPRWPLFLSGASMRASRDISGRKVECRHDRNRRPLSFLDTPLSLLSCRMFIGSRA